jgi:hypothetical protein
VLFKVMHHVCAVVPRIDETGRAQRVCDFRHLAGELRCERNVKRIANKRIALLIRHSPEAFKVTDTMRNRLA